MPWTNRKSVSLSERSSVNLCFGIVLYFVIAVLPLLVLLNFLLRREFSAITVFVIAFTLLFEGFLGLGVWQMAAELYRRRRS